MSERLNYFESLREVRERQQQDKDLHYFDHQSNFFVSRQTNIDDLVYRTTVTSATIGPLQDDETSPSATVYAPHVGDVTQEATSLLMSLPLAVNSTREIPLAASNPYNKGRINIAREKWGAISFASDKQAIAFTEELSADILALRKSLQKCNTKVTFPDSVPDEALGYFKPNEKFGHGWEVFDARKHIDNEALDRVARQRANLIQRDEAMQNILLKQQQNSAAKQSKRSRNKGEKRSPSAEPQLRSSASPVRDRVHAQETDPMDFDVRRAVTDEQVSALIAPDEVAKEIENLKWDFKCFKPPMEWRRKHQKKMDLLEKKAAEWRPIEIIREVAPVEENPCRVTSIPALAPFYTSGVSQLDPKIPVPAAMHGSGVSQQQLKNLRLEKELVLRPEKRTNIQAAVPAPVVVHGATWAELMERQAQLDETLSGV